MITFTHKNNFEKLDAYLKKTSTRFRKLSLETCGELGVKALSESTPKESGRTADSWYYTIERNNDSITISFNNSNIQNGVPIAVILQYGHGTRNGGYVQGRDYINPSVQPIFDRIAKEAWEDIIKV